MPLIFICISGNKVNQLSFRSRRDIWTNNNARVLQVVYQTVQGNQGVRYFNANALQLWTFCKPSDAPVENEPYKNNKDQLG